MTHRILIVDDDPTLQHFTRVVLERAGYTVLSAGNAAAGLEALACGPVDLALLDIRMPGMDGLEMLEELRRTNRRLPVILATAVSSSSVAVEGLQGQVCDFILKPFSAEDLLSAVRTALELSAAGSSIEILSARSDWIEFRIPCTLSAVAPVERLMLQWKADLPEATKENVTAALREMLQNAIEHGGKSDPRRFVEVACVRSARMILYRIKDPGEGFSLASLGHAAITHEDPTGHQRVRDEAGMRAGGFGILIARQMVDEMIYNERRNEVILIKYLSK
ncbi:MAG: response regulator [Acidobacteriota bacterium]